MLLDVTTTLANEILGPTFDYEFLLAVGVSGGILLGWLRELFSAVDLSRGIYSLSARLILEGQHNSWWIMVVYGSVHDAA
jgi:hypothetical protein